MKKLELVKNQIFGTQKKMAEGLGISTSKMSTIFSGEQDMPQEAIERLVLNYKISTYWLFSQDDNYKIEYVTDYVAKSEVEVLQKKLLLALEENVAYRKIENERLKNIEIVSNTG